MQLHIANSSTHMQMLVCKNRRVTDCPTSFLIPITHKENIYTEKKNDVSTCFANLVVI